MWLVKYQSVAKISFCLVYGEEFAWSKYDGTKVIQKWVIPEERQHKTIDQLKQLYMEENTLTAMNKSFSDALELLKAGEKVARAGWNGKDMFIFLVPGSTFQVNRPPLMGIYPEGTEINYHAHVDMRTADGQIVPWLCSQTDMLAEDWETVS